MHPAQTAVFERPLDGSRAVYPCTLPDLATALKAFPESELHGLQTVGLVPATRKDQQANARYFFSPVPTIRIYSYPADLTTKLEPHLTPGRLETLYCVELEFGMEVRAEGGRWFGRWNAEDLRRFTLEFVLAHEVGHHVYHTQRRAQGLVHQPNTHASEQFADAYARRRIRDYAKAVRTRSVRSGNAPSRIG